MSFSFGSHVQIAAEDFQGAVNTVNMAALVAVAGVNAGTDEAVADIAYNQPKSLPYATENPWG